MGNHSSKGTQMQKLYYFFLIIIFTTNVLLLQGCSKKKTEKKATKPDGQIEGKDEQKKIIHGVVYNEGGKPVAGALVLPLPHGGHPVESDVNGKFELMGAFGERLIFALFARDPKHNIAAAVELGDSNKPVEITLIKGVTLSGRVTNPQGKPIAGADVLPSVNRKTWEAGFGYTVFQPTDSNGVYEIKALPVGQDYSIRAIYPFEEYGANSVRVGLVNEFGLKELEDIVLQPAKLTIDRATNRKREPIYDINANAEKQIADALIKAKQNNKNVLLVYGGNWCGWCYKLHDCFNENGNIKRLVQYEYELVKVDIISNKDVPKRFNANPDGYPYLTVLDAEGKVLVNQTTVPLEEGKSHNPDKVYAFLTKWMPKPLNAEEVYKEALTLAEKENKRVFLHFGAPWCRWCHRLEDFLARPEIAKIMAQDYILVKIDIVRMAGAKAIDNRIRLEGGIPWFAILDAKGKLLISSVGPQGNIGYPAKPGEIAHFIHMIRETAQNMTSEQISAIEKTFE
ncbi:MAG: thioredoxin family protein [Planctomycetota bacterium]|jgi:thioredoxin-related protein